VTRSTPCGVGLGWAEELGRQLAESAGKKAAGAPRLRRSWSQDFASGVRGGEQGRASRRVDAALGEPIDGDPFEP